MEQEITDYLVEKFKPEAVLLHGSRATGHAREHSDWDFILLYEFDSELPSNGRLVWHDQNIEYSAHVTPVADVLREFGVKLQHARVVYEVESAGSMLLQQAAEVYSQSLGWSEEERSSHALWMRGRIGGMRDTLDTPVLCEKYAADFYSRITNYWYWAIHDQFAKPIYLALSEIQEVDPEYVALIERFVAGSNEVKVQVAEEVYQRCFGKM